MRDQFLIDFNNPNTCLRQEWILIERLTAVVGIMWPVIVLSWSTLAVVADIPNDQTNWLPCLIVSVAFPSTEHE